jgi:hypothetical protein
MALLKCPECSGEVSDKANACPRCGYPLKTEQPFPKKKRRPGSGMAITISILAALPWLWLIIVLIISLLGDPPTDDEFLLTFYYFPTALLAPAWIVFLIWLYQTWDTIPVEYRNATPGQAVGFLFIPFFNFYWIFRAIPGLSGAIEKALHAQNPQTRISTGETVGIIFCIFSILNAVPFVCFISSIFLIIWVNLANSAKNRLLGLEKGQR